jgi:hypothetical protein
MELKGCVSQLYIEADQVVFVLVSEPRVTAGGGMLDVSHTISVSRNDPTVTDLVEGLISAVNAEAGRILAGASSGSSTLDDYAERDAALAEADEDRGLGDD